jgi:hypothetical protein
MGTIRELTTPQENVIVGVQVDDIETALALDRFRQFQPKLGGRRQAGIDVYIMCGDPRLRVEVRVARTPGYEDDHLVAEEAEVRAQLVGIGSSSSYDSGRILDGDERNPHR